MHDSVSRLSAIHADLPAARRHLAEALRDTFWALDLSVREYAGRQALSASSVTRYLNGTIVPPWGFIDDLLHEVSQHRESRDAMAERRLKDLHQAAQDGEAGGWGVTKKLRADLARSIARAAAAEAERDALTVSERSLQRELAAAIAGLDQNHPDRVAEDLFMERDALLAEQARLRFELMNSQLLINAAIDEARELRHELAQRDIGEGAAGETITPAWTPWYSPPSTSSRTYWRQCATQLNADGWTTRAVTSMDEASDRIVGLLADPTGPSRQAKGIVFTTVQGGTSAHVAGVTAKAIDAGYRMVILLRQQLQERVDRLLPALPDTSGIVRLTSPETDYQQLAERLTELEFEKRSPDLPLYDPDNLERASVRLLVVKRNASVLAKLLGDVAAVKTPLDEIPALVIDVAAEAHPTDHDSKLGTQVAQLLTILPRAQYVAYTKDPYARLDSRLGGGRSHLADFAVSLPHPADWSTRRSSAD